MRLTLKLGLAALLAASVMATAVGIASARNLSVSNQNFRIVWTPLEFNAPEGTRVRCNVTMDGTFHTRTIAKVANALLGYVTRAIVEQPSCRESVFNTAVRAIPWNGTETSLGATIANSLPWHVTYLTFTGTLPNISGVGLLLHRVRFTLEIPLTSCLASYGRDDTRLTGTVNLSSGVATTLTPGTNRAPRFQLIRGTCPPEGSFSGPGAITLFNNTSRITVTLI